MEGLKELKRKKIDLGMKVKIMVEKDGWKIEEMNGKEKWDRKEEIKIIEEEKNIW